MTQLSPARQIKSFILNLLFPAYCVGCKKPGTYFCSTCQQTIPYITPPVCNRCGYPQQPGRGSCHQCHVNPLYHLDSIRSVAFFQNGPLKTAIHQMKYNNLHALITQLAPLLAAAYTCYALTADVIIPVPLHQSRYQERGFNQSELLAKELANLLTLPVDTHSLIRHRATLSQMTLNAAHRKENVATAFICQSSTLTNKTVLLIDDVCTTGSTLDACAEALKKAYCPTVHGLTLARAM